MFSPEKIAFKPFTQKAFLATPTMHGEELDYIRLAYDTNWMSTVGENINEVERIAAEKGYTMVEDAGRGYRQVVPSPKPFDIVEAESIKALFNAGHVVIAVGGGGIPVGRKDGRLCGTPAVIDKDFGSELLAELLDADVLVILTAVEQVAINFNTPEQEEIDSMTVAEARKYIAEGQFAPGSMLPKVEACIEYVRAFPEGKALITSLERAKDALEGKTGTVITA